MSDQMPHDEELRALYRNLPADEPRAEIDEAILAAARERSHDARRRRFLSRMKVMVPLAAAAGVVLTIAIARYLPDSGQVRMEGLDETPSRASRYADPLQDKDDTETMELGDSPSMPQAAPPVLEKSAPKDVPPAGEVRMAPDGSPAAQLHREALSPHELDRPRAQESAKKRADSRDRDLASARPPAPAAPAPEAKQEQPAADEAAGLAARSSAAPAARAEAAQGQPWPFRLEPGLDADEACRRIVAALRSACGFRADVAVIDVAPATKVDAGPFAGATIRRLTLRLRDGRLDRVALDLEGYAGEQILAAPPR